MIELNYKKLGSLALISLGLLLPACTNSEPNENQLNSSENNISVEDVIETPQNYIGQTVTLDGTIGEPVGTSSFVLEKNDGLGQDDNILIINTDSTSSTPLVEDDQVQITGEVRQFILAEFERDYDLKLDLDVRRQIEAEYEGKPVIVAQSIQQAQEGSLQAPGTSQ